MRFVPGSTEKRRAADGFILLDVILALTMLVIGGAALTGGLAGAVGATTRSEQRLSEHITDWNTSVELLLGGDAVSGEQP